MGTDWANDTFGGGIQEWAGAALAAAGASDFIQSLVVDGIPRRTLSLYSDSCRRWHSYS